jgi:hypothetical protein
LRVYTQTELDDLIAVPKLITEAPKKAMRLERGSRRNDMGLQSEDKTWDFSAFMRVNETFPENFSIGLNYLPRDERGMLCLLRCNGRHGEYLGGPQGIHHLYHVHRAKAANLEAGFRAERGGEPTSHYASYEEALAYFVKVANVKNASEFFPNVLQRPFSFEGHRKMRFDED